jgi:hypothetical protein
LLNSLSRFTNEQNSDWEVCGEAENGKVAVEKVKELHVLLEDDLMIGPVGPGHVSGMCV